VSGKDVDEQRLLSSPPGKTPKIGEEGEGGAGVEAAGGGGAGISSLNHLSSLANIWNSYDDSDAANEEFFTVTHDYRRSESLPGISIPINENSSARDEVIDSIMLLIQPHPHQIAFRQSARNYITKQARRVLSAKVYETGLHSVKCFLPDDPIRLSVILWRGHMPNWYTHLSDRLSRLSDRHIASGGASGYGGSISGSVYGSEMSDDGLDLDLPIEEATSGIEHVVSQVAYNNSKDEYRVSCNVDALNVEIMPNSRTDLCLLAFIEEFSTLVGKDMLFKRSLILIRAWWVYETSAYLGCQTKHYLSDSVISIMVCSIFNQHHARIFFPLQALCIFLAEYGDLEWADVAVTIQGVVPFRVHNPDEPWLAAPHAGHLINSQLIRKYWDTYNIRSGASVMGEKKGGSGKHDGSASSLSRGSALDDSVSLHSGSSRNEGSRGYGDGASGGISGEGGSMASTRLSSLSVAHNSETGNSSIGAGINPLERIRSFERREINIVHPLSNMNMMTDKMNSRRAKKIAKIFQTGARNMHAALKMSAGEAGGNVEAQFHNFFTGVTTRFGNGWRPDVVGNVLWPVAGQAKERESLQSANWDSDKGDIESVDSVEEEKHVLAVSLEHLWDQILYCNLLLEQRLTESALLTLSKDILRERGAMPVGEIGKMLQELTTMSALSAKLKEKFGGLKKFLERFPELFTISIDHPFNPHVFMRHTLSPEDFEQVQRGIIPTVLMAKFKKAIIIKKKRTASPAPLIEHGGRAEWNSGDGGHRRWWRWWRWWRCWWWRSGGTRRSLGFFSRNASSVSEPSPATSSIISVVATNGRVGRRGVGRRCWRRRRRRHAACFRVWLSHKCRTRRSRRGYCKRPILSKIKLVGPFNLVKGCWRRRWGWCWNTDSSSIRRLSVYAWHWCNRLAAPPTTPTSKYSPTAPTTLPTPIPAAASASTSTSPPPTPTPTAAPTTPAQFGLSSSFARVHTTTTAATPRSASSPKRHSSFGVGARTCSSLWRLFASFCDWCWWYWWWCIRYRRRRRTVAFGRLFSSERGF